MCTKINNTLGLYGTQCGYNEDLLDVNTFDHSGPEVLTVPGLTALFIVSRYM